MTLGAGARAAQVVAVEPLGAETHLVVRAGDIERRAVTRAASTATGGATRCPCRSTRDRAMVFDADGDGRG